MAEPCPIRDPFQRRDAALEVVLLSTRFSVAKEDDVVILRSPTTRILLFFLLTPLVLFWCDKDRLRRAAASRAHFDAFFQLLFPFYGIQRAVHQFFLVITTMVIKFMVLAWFIGALIHLYVPETWITTSLGGDKPWAIITAAFLGIPVYTSNLTAMPLVGGLIRQGMHPAAALAFLIAGPTTTLPAMSAVWGLVNRKVFTFYIGLSLVGAIVLGYIYSLTL